MRFVNKRYLTGDQYRENYHLRSGRTSVLLSQNYEIAKLVSFPNLYSSLSKNTQRFRGANIFAVGFSGLHLIPTFACLGVFLSPLEISHPMLFL